MSKSEILYVKGMNISESDGEEDVWDDKKLNDAYDKALRIANAEVAKRVAMSTNTGHLKEEHSNHHLPEHSNHRKGITAHRPTSSKKKDGDVHWKVGMPCRAVYEGDGLEYEAFVLRLINDKECVVRFLGYENSEIVPISSLKPTLGNNERTRQIEQALNDKADDGFGSQSPNCEGIDFSDRVPSPDSFDTAFQRKKKPKKKKGQNQRDLSGFELPEIPLHMPNISILKNMGSMDMPMPPPPMTFTSDRTDSEDQAISSMLLSWYMSGYYTGLYQGMKRAKESRRN